MEEGLVWLTNTRVDGEKYAVRMMGQSQEDASQIYRDWLRDKTIGEPKSTSSYSAEQLKAMGYVGVYCTREQQEAYAALVSHLLPRQVIEEILDPEPKP